MAALLFFVNFAFASPKCFNEAEVKNEVCWALCRQDGYDSGAFKPKTKTCACANEIQFHILSETRLIVPKPTGTKTLNDDEVFQINFK